MISGQPVILIDGTASDTWSAAWRAECLQRHQAAMHVLRLADKEQRNWWIDNEYCSRVAKQLDHLAFDECQAACTRAMERLRAEAINLHQRQRAALAAKLAAEAEKEQENA